MMIVETFNIPVIDKSSRGKQELKTWTTAMIY